jgi:phosphatidylglycerol---prolipoprotein diacylglyceryl transferase
MVYLTFQVFGALLWLIVVYRFLKKEDLDRVFGIDLAFVILLSGFIGGRAFHIFYENPQEFLQDPSRVWAFWRGGFVFYGALIGALVTSIFYCYYKKKDFFLWADFFAPFLALGYSYGRVGCFLVGCCYGHYCDLPWAVEGRHPTQLYAVVSEFLLLLFLLSEKKMIRAKGLLFSWWIIGHTLGRLFMEPYRADFRGERILDLSISQFLSLIGLSMGVFLLVWRFSIYHKK